MRHKICLTISFINVQNVEFLSLLCKISVIEHPRTEALFLLAAEVSYGNYPRSTLLTTPYPNSSSSSSSGLDDPPVTPP